MRKFFLLLTAILILTLPTDCWASGPGVGGRRVRLDNEQAGQYILRAVTSPTPPTIGNFNVEVRVKDLAGLVIEDAMVTISATPSDHESKELQVIATHEYAPLPDEYAAHLPVPTAGLWEVTIHVEGSLGVGQTSFFQQVARPTSINAWLSVGAPFAGLLLLTLLFVWLQRQSNKENETTSRAQ
jgi:hypothetical protein